MSVSGKNMEITCGIAKNPLGKGEHIDIPSERAGEKRVPQIQNMQEVVDYIDVKDHTAVLDEKGRVIQRIDEKGKVLTQAEEVEIDR